MTERVEMEGRWVGEDEPAFILAEVASAHQGDPDQVRALAHAAKSAGADGVKFQLFRAAELVAPNDTRFAAFQKIEIPVAEWERILAETIGSLGLVVLADVFDRPSLGLAERCGVVAYKIHATDMENPDFIREVAATGKPILFSTGGCSLGDVEKALEISSGEGNHRAVLLHGVQNFPTRIEDSQLSHIETLRVIFGKPIGFLDHVDGSSPMARLLPALAVASGAHLVEKHITLDRGARGFDFESALEPEGFADMVDIVRQTEKAIGSHVLTHQPSAELYHRMMRRAVVSREPLPEGEPVRKEQIAFLRNEEGLAPRDAARVLGRRPRRDIAAWEPLSENLFE